MDEDDVYGMSRPRVDDSFFPRRASKHRFLGICRIVLLRDDLQQFCPGRYREFWRLKSRQRKLLVKNCELICSMDSHYHRLCGKRS